MYKLGNLEFVFELTDVETGDKTEVTSTPSMWARASEYQDAMLAKGGHTPGYCVGKYLNYLAMMAAASAGVIKKFNGAPTAEAEAEFRNKYTVKDVSSQYKNKDEEAENPTESDQEENQEA